MSPSVLLLLLHLLYSDARSLIHLQMMRLAGHRFGWGKALLVFASSEKELMKEFVSILHPYRRGFFFFLRIIVRKKIVNCVELDITCLALMIIAYTVWFEPAMSGFSTSMDAKRYG